MPGCVQGDGWLAGKGETAAAGVCLSCDTVVVVVLSVCVRVVVEGGCQHFPESQISQISA